MAKQFNLSDYANKHPGRMASTGFFIGLGAGALALKGRKAQKNSLQKFINQVGEQLERM